MKKRILALLLTISIVVGNGEFVYAAESGNGNAGTKQESTVESKDEDTSEDTSAETTNGIENEEKETEPEKSEPVEQQATESPQSADEIVDKSNELSGECGEHAQWTYDQETKELRISGSGAMSDYNNSTEVPWYGWREEIRSVVIESGITRIGNYAFIYCGGLEEIKLSEGLEEIGRETFEYCSGIKKAEIPDSVKEIGTEAFYSCRSLEEVVVGKGLKSLGGSAFRYCEKLTKLTVKGNIESIGDTVFSNTAIKELQVGKGVSSLKEMKDWQFRYLICTKNMHICWKVNVWIRMTGRFLKS